MLSAPSVGMCNKKLILVNFADFIFLFVRRQKLASGQGAVPALLQPGEPYRLDPVQLWQP